jgi:hypothetical protein
MTRRFLAHMPLSDDGAALRLKDDDDVAVALRPLAPGAAVRFGSAAVTVDADIPTGHKFATRAIAAGALIRKYGQVIGRATEPIGIGAHVHVHNVEGTRGRGDLADTPSRTPDADTPSRTPDVDTPSRTSDVDRPSRTSDVESTSPHVTLSLSKGAAP